MTLVDIEKLLYGHSDLGIAGFDNAGGGFDDEMLSGRFLVELEKVCDTIQTIFL